MKLYGSKLKTIITEEFGLIKVSNAQGKSLSKAYIKCFSKSKSGEVKFYKDGYTDFRGCFDYASLNSDSISSVEKFAVFVEAGDLGMVVEYAKPPSEHGVVKLA